MNIYREAILSCCTCENGRNLYKKYPKNSFVLSHYSEGAKAFFAFAPLLSYKQRLAHLFYR